MCIKLHRRASGLLNNWVANKPSLHRQYLPGSAVYRLHLWKCSVSFLSPTTNNKWDFRCKESIRVHLAGSHGLRGDLSFSWAFTHPNTSRHCNALFVPSSSHELRGKKASQQRTPLSKSPWHQTPSADKHKSISNVTGDSV